jgi:protein-tyrosine-phosphatase
MTPAVFPTPPPSSSHPDPHLVFVCTGNAARSVMATVIWRARTDALHAVGAGTHVIEGHPMSRRTRAALARLGLADPSHRSTQLARRHLGAELIVTMEPLHVTYVRRHHPEAAARTATLKRLVRDLPGTSGPLAERVAALRLHEVEPEPWEEVVDPGSGEQDAFDACIDELDVLVDDLLRLLTGAPPPAR